MRPAEGSQMECTLAVLRDEAARLKTPVLLFFIQQTPQKLQLEGRF